MQDLLCIHLGLKRCTILDLLFTIYYLLFLNRTSYIVNRTSNAVTVMNIQHAGFVAQCPDSHFFEYSYIS